jgi:hypothetical protein
MAQKFSRFRESLEEMNKLGMSRGLLLAGAFTSVVWIVYFSIVTIAMPYQIELREGTALVITRLLLMGKNPFTFENHPLAMTNYGIGYNLVVLPVAALFGSTLFVHRTVTFVLILFSAAICFLAVYKKNKEISLALICATFVAASLIGRGGIGAFPSATGAFLFLVAVLVPYLRSFDTSSLVASAFISLFAFYTKPYFILSFGIVAAYLFLFVSKMKAGVYSLLFTSFFSIVFLGVRVVLPLYFIDTLTGNINNIQKSPEHLKAQLIQLFFYFYPTLVLAIIIFIKELSKRRPGQFFNSTSKRTFNLFNWQQPFINHSMDYLFYSSVCSFLAFVLILGPHKGNYLVYAYQIIIPLFFCWLFQNVDLNHKLGFAAVLLILLNLFLWEKETLNPVMLKQRDSKEWAELYGYVSSAKNVLNNSVVTSEIVEMGIMPVDAGQTLVYYIMPYKDNNLFGPSYSSWHENGVKYTKYVDQNIKNKNFDLVVTTMEKADFYHVKLLDENYSLVTKIKVEMPQTDQNWTMLLWRPLPNPSCIPARDSQTGTVDWICPSKKLPGSSFKR